ncbi:hypothetical protein D3C85_1306890 [compost metagenome]
MGGKRTYQRNNRPTDVDGGIPASPPEAALVARIPVGEQARARRPAPSLKESVQRPDEQQQAKRIAEGEQYVQHAGGQQADPHKRPLSVAVVPQSGGKFRQSVAQIKQRPDKPDVTFAQP